MAQSKGQQRRERQRREALQAQKAQERFIAQQRREAERQEREAKRADALAERDRKVQYLAERTADADELANATAARAETLATVLITGLKRQAPLDFRMMRLDFAASAWSPGNLANAEQPPRWESFAPPEPGFLSRVFGGDARYNQAVQQARLRFEQEQAAHLQREAHRAAQLEQLRQQHAQREGERKRHVDQHNVEIDALRQAFRQGDRETVERCLRLALEAAPLPDGVPREVEVGYRKDSRQVLIVREMPNTDVIPTEVAFRYVKVRDVIESTPRKPAEVRQRYADLIAQLALLALRDTFTATSAQQVSEVTVNCHLSTTDRATGKAIRPCLLTVSATRDKFDELVLDKLEPRDCLRHLNALMSPHPYDVEPIKPIFDPDLTRFRLVDAHSVAAGLDSRTVLVEQTPNEFEHLVRELFEAMGMKSWVTQASRDDGLDAIAVNPDPVMGGLAVIQAKRYFKSVPVEAVRALWGTMEDKKAGTGILVTTSYFGKAGHDFAHRNERLRLIEGPELKHLIKEFLDRDVIVGAKEPPKNRR
ncbi:restriction endonuclease [Amycolatopsis roodepoortensis]|uniref:Restriction system protein n=1 Tax=Amycolatopsis roodepoortensis TaxID=700274 RepID=A0ABR9L5R9_9PSEU|nr:restriction endonuclease [Amycolatopsis roodepoortensis]MBE1576069.1 restriction system protein [Amycolatopsis roodepoortensis]